MALPGDSECLMGFEFIVVVFAKLFTLVIRFISIQHENY